MDFKIIAVDFDGTLCENKWPQIGAANQGLIKHLKEEQKKGNKIILWTCRAGERLTEAISWCANYDLHFEAINENLPEVLHWMGGDSRKIFAHIYIDDRCCTEFKLPFIGTGITDDLIYKVEQALGFSVI